MTGPVNLEKNGPIAIVRINRPEVLNALNQETKRQLTDAFTQLAEDDSTTAIVLTGTGDRAFCAGQDIHESVDMDGEAAVAWVKEFDHLYQSLRRCMKPIIASIQGYAAGSGFQLALLADIRIAAADAKFGMTEINVGIPCITGATLLWPILGRARTLDLILTGRFLSAAEAHAWGVATEVVEADANPLERAQELAQQLGAAAPTAIRFNKEWLNELTEEVYQRGVAFAQAAHRRAYSSGEAAEHMQRFLDKRA